MNTRVAWGLAVCLLGAVASHSARAEGLHVFGQNWSTYGKSLSDPVNSQGGRYHMHSMPHNLNLHHERYATFQGHYTTGGGGAGGMGSCLPGLCMPGCPAGYCPPGCPPGYCPPGCPPGYGAGLCPHGLLCNACPHCCHLASALCRDWTPTHHHHFTYSQPTGLVYPPANQPPAVVQYPYYTTKGPDDFFLDRD